MTYPDVRLLDRSLREARRFADRHPDLQGRALDDALNAHLQTLEERSASSGTPAERALDLCHEAYGNPDIPERMRLAREALTLDPGCPEAFELLAEGEDDNLDAALGWLERALEAGRARLGEARIADLQGRLSADVDARVILRAKLLMARLESLRGNHAAAVRHGRELLRLDASGANGAPLFHLVHLLQAGRDGEALALAEELIDFEAEEAAARGPLIALFGYACALFRTEGGTDRACGALFQAVEANPALLALPLQGIGARDARMPAGDADEAMRMKNALATYTTFAPLFKEDPALGTWVGETLAVILTAATTAASPESPSGRQAKKPRRRGR